MFYLFLGRDPFNQNFRAEVRKFLGANGSRHVRRSSSIPLSKRVSCSFKNEDVGSLLLVLELDDKFDFSNDIVRTVSCVKVLLGLF